uniref:TIM-barrel domain-containing protein n=1 Tax=Flavobacterium sp. TaxID=239 RepID=UPI004049AF83
MKFLSQIVLLFFFTFTMQAQNPNRIFENVSADTNGPIIIVNDGEYHFRFLNNYIIETAFVPKGEIQDKESHAVVLKPEFVKNFGFKATLEQITLENESNLKVVIQKKPFQISYFYKDQKIISEKEGYHKSETHEKISFNIQETEKLMGGGARVLGMNRRGNRLELYNRAHYGYENRSELMNFTLPIVISSQKYMVHFDNAPIGFLDLDSQKNNTLTYETISGNKRYQIIVGDSWQKLTENYTTLTGRQPLPARWVFGNFASRFGYHSEAETRKTVAKFESENVPIDAIILDLYWFGKEIQGTMGNLEVFRDSFPTFEKMVADFSRKGIKTIPITEPFILTTSKKWNEAVEKKVLATDSIGKPFTYDFYFGNTGIVDVFKPEAQQWFWNIYKDLATKGVGGVWGDLGEPEVFPSEAQTAAGSADEVHNIYGHQWAKTIFEGYQNDFPNQRPFILMRAGAAGSQRFGMIPWSGDVNRTWGGLSGQMEIALQMGLQGFGYMHSDLGGFAGANLDDELYVRWLQYGVFQPVFRPHAQEEVAPEPVFRAEKAKKLASEAIQLRYKLLPYNYQLAHENNQKGTPLMRPLFFDEPENESLFEQSAGYFWGNDFLVYPVIKPQETSKSVYFPQGNDWVDFYDDSIYEGGITKNIKVSKSHIPTFVRKGTFIPMLQYVTNTTKVNFNQLEIHYYYDENATEEIEKSWYFDDGETPEAFEKEQFEILTLEAEKERKYLEIDIERSVGKNYQSAEKEITFVLHLMAKKPKNIKEGSKKIPFSYHAEEQTVTFKTTFNQSEKEIKIKL